jgi:hypothetical protein
MAEVVDIYDPAVHLGLVLEGVGRTLGEACVNRKLSRSTLC